MIKVTYTPDTLVNGNYSSKRNYPSITIDKDAKKILNAEGELLPYIEILEEDQIFDKTMCVIDGVYQEYVKPDSELLQEAKDSKVAQVKVNRDSAQLKPVTTPSLATAPLLLGFGQGLAGEDVNFSFDTKPTENSLTDPLAILTDLISDPETQSTDYATERLDTGEDCYVRLDKTITQAIKNHLKVRFISNIAHARDLVKQINDCTTVEEVNNIDITFS